MSHEITNAIFGDWKAILEKAIIDEYEAITFYDEILTNQKAEFIREVIEEIRADEWNHIGRLMDLLRGYMSESERKALKLGLAQKEDEE